MKNLNVNELNITEDQKKNIKGWLKFTKQIPVFIHKDKDGYIYETGFHKGFGRNVTHKITKSGLWDSKFNDSSIENKNFELLHDFGLYNCK